MLAMIHRITIWKKQSDSCEKPFLKLIIGLLCRILVCQDKYIEAKQILSACLQKVQRVYGPSHPYTSKLFDLDTVDLKILPHI